MALKIHVRKPVVTPRAPPTKNSRFCSTEGAGPGGVAARGSSARPGYRAGAAAAGKCPRDGLGGGGLISAEHSCWGPRETEERAVPGWSRSLGRGAVCAGPALERGALGTATLRERARPRDWAGSGTCGVRSPVRRWAGDPPQLPVTAAAQGGERSAPRAAGTEIPELSRCVRGCFLPPPPPRAESPLPSLAGFSVQVLFYSFCRKQATRSQIRNEPPLGKVVTEKGKASIFAFPGRPLLCQRAQECGGWGSQ